MDIKIGEQIVDGDCVKHGQVFCCSVQVDNEDTFFVCEKCFDEVVNNPS